MVNTLVFVDLPVSDIDAATTFYEQLFGWQVNPRPKGEFHQIVPGEGLHLGLWSEEHQVPDPSPRPVEPRSGPATRTYVLVDDDPATYLDKAVGLGAQRLWGKQWWAEFEGWHASFRDPWGNQVVIWWKEPSA